MSQGLRGEYERRVMVEAAFSGNRVPALQGKFRVSSMASSIATGYNYYSSAFNVCAQAPDGALVFLKSKGDMKIYRGFMAVCGVGMAITGICLAMMATGTMPKKERPS